MTPYRHEASIGISIFTALTLTVVSLSALAQDKPQRDSSGTVMDLSKWHAISPHEFMLNIADLPDAVFTIAQRRVRDNRLTHERVRIGKTGAVLVEHFHSGTYSENAVGSFQSGEFARRFAEGYWKRRGDAFSVDASRRIYRFGERGGMVLSTRGQRSGTVCIVSRLAFLSDEAKSAEFTHEVYDTAVFFRDCAAGRTLGDVAAWLEGVKIVEPPYNRVR